MIRPKLSLRRPLAVLGAAFVGLAAAVAVAAPASAHHSTVEPSAICDTATGEWVVTWTVNTFAPEDAPTYRLVKADVTPVGSTVDGIAVTDGDGFPHETGKPLVGTQRLPGDATEASLTIQAKWSNNFTEDGTPSGSIKFTEKCEKDSPKPTATLASTCDGVVVTLANGEDAKVDAVFTVKGEMGFEETRNLKPGENDVKVEVPADKAGKVVVIEKGNEEPLAEGEWTEPKDCVKPGEPAGSFQSTCDELIFEIANPQDGQTVTVTFTPNKGEAKTVTVAAGETKTVKFPAEEGLTVTPSADGMDETEPIAWAKPEGCETGGGGGEPGLPVTGAAAGGIAAGAAILLAIGGLLFFLARRRRVTFTA